MKTNEFYIDPAYEQQFLEEMYRSNLQRWKPFAAAIIGIELILLIILICAHSANTSFKYGWYALMYTMMIVVTSSVWILFLRMEHKLNHGWLKGKQIDLTILSYLGFLMTWGAVIALLDQDLYSNIVAFLVNMVVGSFMFYVNSKRIIIPQLLACAVLFMGLPHVQPSGNILIGHYANVSIFMVICWVIARTNYAAFVKNFLNQRTIEENADLLAEINGNLIKEITSRERTQRELEAANEQLTAISSTDSLTGLLNRRKLDQSLQEQWNTAVSEQIPLIIMMIDIDLFKLYNDTYGHLAGDYCLRDVAGVLNKCRQGVNDVVARFGGEEFLFAAIGIAREEALLLGEKIRTEIEILGRDHLSSSISPYITVSVGISWQIPASTDLLTESIARADQAMYKAKHAGRNQVMIAE